MNSLRILLDEKPAQLNLTIKNRVFFLNENDKIAELNKGSTIQFSQRSKKLNARIGDRNYYAEFFRLIPADGETISYNNKTYKGSLRIVPFGKFVDIINYIDLENYLKGVIPKEMPLGTGNENYEALKAFAICARTYALKKINEGKKLFDIFSDTRDQVYAGESAEELISSRAVEETRGTILVYDKKPAVVYYHSTCGGFNENVENVFRQTPLPYLISVKDGEKPFCKISPRFEWEEVYSENQFIDKLFEAKLINEKNYNISDINISRKFASGRIDDLEIILDGRNGRKEIHLFTGEIRSRIRTPERNLLLWSTMFNVEKRSNGNIMLTGKGFGHGVGLCQWGSIGQSQMGIEYTEILEHYFPGTELRKIND
jgi:stage II sporulation protein D